MTDRMDAGLMGVAGRVARPVASCGLCINPVDNSTYPRINGRAKEGLSTHKRSRPYA